MPRGRPPSDNPKSEVTLIRQTPEEKAEWKKSAKAQGLSVAELIREAVEEYLAKRRKRKR